MPFQLPLPVTLPGGASFDNFEAGANQEAARSVERSARGDGERVIVVWGKPGTGKTHLLASACKSADLLGMQSSFLPLAQSADITPAILLGLEHVALICLDDLHAVAGQSAWEHALFSLYNLCERSGACLLVAARSRMSDSGIALNDLKSRLSGALAFQLRELDDTQRRRAIQVRAAGRGFEISDDVAAYLLRRHARDMHTLMRLVERLDHSTLAAQRRVTIPFIKELLG